MRFDDDADVRRCTPRLLRFSRHVGAGIQRLSVGHFVEEVHYCPMAYEVLNRIDLSRFHRLAVRERPHDHGGLLRWRLRPRDAETVVDLPAIMATLLAQSCGFGTILVRREVREKDIRFRFVIDVGTHAHTGRIDFYGRAVECVLLEGRNRVEANRCMI